MWNEQYRLLNAQLEPNEQLLWSGQSRQGLNLRPSDAYAIPVSILWCGFAVIWNSSIWFSDMPFLFRLWGLPFLIGGLYMVIGRFFIDRWQRSRTYYGVTNERIIIVSGLFTKDIKSLFLKTLTDMTLSERKDLSGTITFGPQLQNKYGPLIFFSNNNKTPVFPIFDSIQEAKKVYDIIRNAQRAAM